MDTCLLDRLTKGNQGGGALYATRTQRYDTKNQHWDEALKEIFGLSKIILPEVRESSSNFGSTTFEDIFDKDINIFGVIGDSQASMVANQ